MRTSVSVVACALVLVSALTGCADARAPGVILVLLSDDAFVSDVAIEVDGIPARARRPIAVDPATAVVVGRGTRTSLADLADAELVIVLGPAGDLAALDERTMRVDLARVEGDRDSAARLARAIGADLAPSDDGAWELVAPEPWAGLAALPEDPEGIDRVLPVLLDPLADLDALRAAAATPSADPTLPSASLFASAGAAENLELALFGGGEWLPPRARPGRGRIAVRAPMPGRFTGLSWVVGGSGCGQGWMSSSRRQLAALELRASGAATMCGAREERAWLGGNAGIDYGEDRARMALEGTWREVEQGTVDVELREAPDACPGRVVPTLAEHRLLREPLVWGAEETHGARIVLRCVAVWALDDTRWGEELLACRDVTPGGEARAAGGLDTSGDLLEGLWVLLGRGAGIATFGEQSFWAAAPPAHVMALSEPVGTAAEGAFPAALRRLGNANDAQQTSAHCATLDAIASPQPAGVIRFGDDVRGPDARARLDLLCGRAAR